MGDVDAVNIYYATYYEWMDRALGEFFAQAGHPVSSVFEAGFAIPIVQSGCAYLSPVAMDEVLVVRTWIARTGRSSFTMAHDFIRTGDGGRVAHGVVDHVWARRAGMTPVAIPDWFASLARPGGEAPAVSGGDAARPGPARVR